MFKAFPKIPRYAAGPITITEKIDGTNACLIIADGKLAGVQSRNQMIEAGADNMGFRAWAEENHESLCAVLDDGYHYGEWAGPGIQKNRHDLPRKVFVLFGYYEEPPPHPDLFLAPVLYHGARSDEIVRLVLQDLWVGNLPRFGRENARPEGIVIYDHTLKTREKMTFDNPTGKWRATE